MHGFSKKKVLWNMTILCCYSGGFVHFFLLLKIQLVWKQCLLYGIRHVAVPDCILILRDDIVSFLRAYITRMHTDASTFLLMLVMTL